jgi:chemotaxis protein histidine kinase CheA
MATPQERKPDTAAIPPAVRRMAEEAERRQKEYIEQGKPPEEKQEAQDKQDSEDSRTAAPPPAPEPAPAPEPQPEVTPKVTEPDWKQRFETEQGRNRKLLNEVSELSSEISNLRRVLSTVKTDPTPQPTHSETTPVSIEGLLSAEERQEWGEVLPVIEKVARGLVEPLQRQLQDRIGQLDQKVTTVREHNSLTEKQRMLQILDDPNNAINKSGRKWGPDGGGTWRDVNRDEEFVGWLQYVDPLSGQKRHDMLTEAFSANDASRVGAFFANFLRDVQAVAPPQPQTSTPAPNGSAPSLEDFAAPGKARTAAAAPAPAEEIITTGDIARFYTDLQKGRWKGREDEAKQYEAKIFAAQNAGRVRPGVAQP